MGRHCYSPAHWQDVTYTLYKMTHWEKRSSFLSSPETYSGHQHIATSLLAVVTLWWIIRRTDKQSLCLKNSASSHSVFCCVRVVADICKPLPYSLLFGIFLLSLISIGSSQHVSRIQNWEEDNRKLVALPPKFIWHLFQAWRDCHMGSTEILSLYTLSFCSTNLIMVLLLLCGDVEVNPGPFDESAEPQDIFGDVMKAVAEDQQIKTKMANIILQGLPESGKTSLLDRLLNRPIRSYYCSTGIFEATVTVDISPTSTLSAALVYDDSTWKVTDFDKSLVAQLDHVRAVLKKYDMKNIKDLQTINSLYIRDTGGQVEFQESLSLMIYGPSIFIFVMKANIDINTKHIIQYRSPTGEIINRYVSSISTVDALLQFLTSVSAIETTEDGVFQKEDGTYLSHKPIVFIVGTHIDQLGSEAISVIDKMNNDLDKLIRGNSFLELVHYADGRLNKVMYLVDNTSKEDHSFQVLRSSINRFINTRSEFTIEYPVSYLLFCLELQSIKKTVISMDDCITLAAKFGIKESDIKHLLHFLHFRVGIIQHYDVKGLSDLIIKEPQVLFNKVTDLVVSTFLQSGSLNMSQQDSFCKKGILEASAFDHIMSGEDKITSKQFLYFLLHLRMAVPFTDKKGILKFFIPSVLNHVPKPLCNKNRTDVAPLAITFESGHCPKGLLGMMVSYLINPEKSHEVTFDLLEDKVYQDQVSLLAHSRENMDEVCIKRYLSHLEIEIFFEKFCTDEESETLFASRANTPTKVCSDICTILQDCLQQSLKMLHYDYKKVGPMFCVACPQENCEQFHEVKKGKGDHYMHCSTNRVKLQLPKSGRHWFKEGIREPSLSYTKTNSKTLTGIPLWNTQIREMRYLNLIRYYDSFTNERKELRILDELAPKWELVGDILGFKPSEIETIRNAGAGKTPFQYIHEVIIRWMQNADSMPLSKCYPCTWKGLYNMLVDSKHVTVANDVKAALKATYSNLHHNFDVCKYYN